MQCVGVLCGDRGTHDPLRSAIPQRRALGLPIAVQMSLDAAAAGRGERMMRRLFEEAVAELTAAEEGEGATEVTASTPAQRGRRWGRTAASSPVDKRGGTLSDATLSARIQTAEELAEAVLHDRRIKELAFTVGGACSSGLGGWGWWGGWWGERARVRRDTDHVTTVGPGHRSHGAWSRSSLPR